MQQDQLPKAHILTRPDPVALARLPQPKRAMMRTEAQLGPPLSPDCHWQASKLTAWT